MFVVRTQDDNVICVQAQYRNDAGSMLMQASACSIRAGVCVCVQFLLLIIIVLLLTWYENVLQNG